MAEVSVLRYPFGTLDETGNILDTASSPGLLRNWDLSSECWYWVKSARNKNCKMPPPGGGAGGANVGYIKEKPDPWEVRAHLFAPTLKIFWCKQK